jgi:peptide/nickel transport system substrate-binding protein
MHRSAMTFFIVCILALILAACGGGAQPAAQQQPPAQAPAQQAPAQQPAQPQAPAQQPAQKPAEQKPAEAPKAAAPTQAAAAKPAAPSGGTITEGTFADAKTLNSVLSNDTSSAAMITMLGNGLVKISPDNLLPIEDLATKWAVSADNLTYTFTLRNGVKFHDGQPFTAEDVKFTYELMLNEKVNSPRRSSLAVIDSITVKSPTEIEFKLKSVTADFLVTHSSYQILPKHILGSVAPEAINTHDFNTKSPIYTGPFKFKEWVKDDHMTLVANPDYFLGKPKIDQYIYKVVQDQNVVVAQLKTGEMDWGGITPALLAEMEKQANLTIKAFDVFSFTFYSYNLDPAKTDLFQDVKVRQALLYALDRDAMVKAIMFGQGSVADTSVPPISWAFNQANQPQYKFDTAQAEKLLDEAGWAKGADGIRAKDGKKLSFSCYTNAGNKTRESYVTVMQEQWRKVGVEMTPKTEEWNAFLDRITKTRDFECFLVGFSWGVDPNQKTMWHTASYNGGFNMNKYSNPELDKILDDALNTTDVNKRKELYFKMQEIVARDVPSVILDFPKSLIAVNKRVVGLEPKAVGTRNNVHEWAVTDGK